MMKPFPAASAALSVVLAVASFTHANDAPPDFQRDLVPLLKRHCVKCHGPAKQEAKLNLAAASSLVRGGKSGAAVVPHDADASLLWQRVTSDEMPPDGPLTADEKSLLKRWIVAGTPGLTLKDHAANAAEHWAFRPLASVSAAVTDQATSAADLPLDSFLASELARDRLTFAPEADRATQIRRVSYDLTGLPPTPEAIAEFVEDRAADAYARMVDRYLASPHFGERFGKLWLDAAGYADSNGYFNADSDRPLAYRYRDYVLRSFNSDKPFDQFVREQFAGDELAGGRTRNGETLALSVESQSDLSPSTMIELLEATHYLRNGQDGSGESDGNPDEVRVDRYTVIETAMQNVSTGLLGLTIHCAKCHDHKFEPLTQRDYYAFQAVLIPAFPPEQWVIPNNRFVYASLPGEVERWQVALAKAETTVNQLQTEIGEWVKQHRPRGTVVFADHFDGSTESLANSWSHTAPGDDAPAGTPPVNVNSRTAPGAIIVDGRLQLIEGGSGDHKWLCTRTAIDWSPDTVGDSIQVTFDLVENRVGDSPPAARFGYMLAAHDFNDSSPIPGGNILIDGHPTESSAAFLDYPGNDSKQIGVLGTTGYLPGRNYGVRITNQGKGQFLLEHLVDWQVEAKPLTLTEADLPAGGFGFEYCCGRSFVVDNVVVESFTPTDGKHPLAEFLKELKSRRGPLDEAIKSKAVLTSAKPGKIAWTTDVTATPPQTHVLLRGNYNTPGEPVAPATYAILKSINLPTDSGRRLGFANSITQPNSIAASLLARVQVNRLWQHHFGVGLVSTPDNFGLSGSPPSHPELLDWLAAELVRSGWSTKHVVKLIVNSSAYTQCSSLVTSPRSSSEAGTSEERQQEWSRRLQFDPDARRLSRFPVRRLDAEAIRDGMLFASGDLDDRLFGPYISTTRTGTGETIVAEGANGSTRRSIYLQQKRTQVHSLLQLFDAPSIVFNSTRRPRSTMPLQSLNQLNADFSVARARSFSQRLHAETTSDSERLQRAFVLAHGRQPSDGESSAASEFLAAQEAEYAGQPDARPRAWSDLAQMLLIGNPALYLE